MHPTAEEFAAQAKADYEVDVEVKEFPEGTKTANDAAEAIGCSVAEIGSSLLFMAGDDPVIVVTSGANNVDEDRFATYLEVDTVRMANPDEVRDATGWGIGGVPPFCHATEIPVFLDETLMDFDQIWVAAGTPQAVFPIEPDRIIEIADATPVDVTA